MIYLQLFVTFFEIGLFTFGGGYAMISLIRDKALALGWLTEEQLLNMIAVAESTPGPIAVNMATFVGSTQGGVLGALTATLGVVLPSFIVILIVARFYEKYKQSRIVKGCMTGLKPAVVGLIGFAILKMILAVFVNPNATKIEDILVSESLAIFTSPAFYVSLGTCATMLVLAFKKVHPIILVCCSAVIGIVAGYLGVWG